MRILIILMLAAPSAFAGLLPPTPEEIEQKNNEAAILRFTSPAARTSAPPTTLSTPPPAVAKSVGRRVGRHLVFDSQEEAEAWMTAKEAELQGSFRDPALKVVHNHPYKPVIQKYVDELWRGYKELFPLHTAHLNTPPPVVIIDTKVSNAFVDGDGESMAHAVFVLTGLVTTVNGVENKDGLIGILSHEIGHSIFLHGIESESSKIQHFLVRSGHTLDFKVPRNSKLDQDMAKYLIAARTVGDLTFKELLNMPSPGYGNPFMFRIWAKLREELARTTTQSCKQIESGMIGWQSLMPFNALRFDFALKGELSLLETRSQELISTQKACLANRKITLAEIFAKVLHVDVEALQNNLEFRKYQRIFESYPDPVSGLQALVELDRKAMKDIQDSFAFDQLGYYTTEQHADDASALVLAHLKEDPAAFNVLLKLSMEETKKGDIPACDKTIESGDVPALGSLFVIHHSYCYRIYNFLLLKKQIAAEGTQAVAKEFLAKTLGE